MAKKDIYLFELSNYVKPEIKETYGRKWVENGKKNWFYQFIIDRFNGSPTNEAIINTSIELIFGKGIREKGQDEIYEGLNDIFPKSEQKKCLSDRKLFGECAIQIQRARGGGVAKLTHLPINKLAKEKKTIKVLLKTCIIKMIGLNLILHLQ